jgi:hypothetical protein
MSLLSLRESCHPDKRKSLLSGSLKGFIFQSAASLLAKADEK